MPKLESSSVRGLIVYDKTKKYIFKIRKVVLAFPSDEGELIDQVKRSTTSIASNIAEGHSQMTLANRLKYYNIAFCSLRESQAQLDIALLIGCIDSQNFKKLDEQAEEIARMLYVLMLSVKRKIANE